MKSMANARRLNMSRTKVQVHVFMMEFACILYVLKTAEYSCIDIQ